MNVMFAQFGGAPPFFMFIFVAIFVFVIGKILFTIGSGVNEWASNNAQPQRCDDAEIVAKRTEVSGGQKSTSTTYYATFELVGGVRKELEVDGDEYGQFAEGDAGRLTHQGTRFLGFVREPRRQVGALPPIAEIPQNLLCAYCGSAIPSGKIKCDGCGWTWKPAPKSEVNA